MDLGINGRVAFVTGAGRGIGREICTTLAAEGARIAVNDLFQDRADETAEIIRGSGGQAIGVAQISRKGETPREAGPDFTSADLRHAQEILDGVAHYLADARPTGY